MVTHKERTLGFQPYPEIKVSTTDIVMNELAYQYRSVAFIYMVWPQNQENISFESFYRLKHNKNKTEGITNKSSPTKVRLKIHLQSLSIFNRFDVI